MLVQWENDFSTDPTRVLGAERERAGPPPIAIIYPSLGSTPEEGHDGLYLAMGQWEPDVLRFLDQALRH